jgi:hypothetical protein
MRGRPYPPFAGDHVWGEVLRVPLPGLIHPPAKETTFLNFDVRQAHAARNLGFIVVGA